MSRIALPLSAIKDHYDVVVIGSGYGGGIAASRMARAGRSVCLLERGREIVSGEYPDTPAEAAEEFQLQDAGSHIGSRTALFDLHINQQQSVMVGCGLGGTSLINANVALEPQPELFDDPRWPRALREQRDTALRDGFARAREMLRPAPYPATAPQLAKLEAHRRSAAAMGQEERFYLPPLNINFEALPEQRNHVGVEQRPCDACGDCVAGCNRGAKNTTLMNYLPDARNHGAEIFCQAAVRYLHRDGDGWIVHYQYIGSGREQFSAPTLFVRASIVIVAAGTLGSTEILLRSQQRGLALSTQLGERFSGNGDMLGFGYNCDMPINGIGTGSRKADAKTPAGPCIASIIDLRNQPERHRDMVIEEGSIPGAIGALLQPALSAAADLVDARGESGLAAAAKYQLREWESTLRGPYHGAVHNTQIYLVMSHDDSAGRMYLNDDDRLQIDWPGVGEQDNFIAANERLQQSTDALGGIYVPNPLWSDIFRHRLISVHPLGGCAMADDAAQGVVNDRGQVFSGASGTAFYDSLYVCDGAVLPGSLAVNPLLTISALAERSMALLAADRGWSIDYTLPSAPAQPALPDKLGIAFTETMRGFFSMAPGFSNAFTQHAGTDLDKYEQAFARGRDDASPIEFTVTVSAADLDRLITDPSHPGTIVGTLLAPSLSPEPLTVSQGEFNLFETWPEQVGMRHMNYRMRLSAEDGAHYYFSGFKAVPEDHSLLRAWADTSTLYVTIRRGSDDTGAVVGSGVMHIRPADFAKQMTTLKVSNARDERERLGAIARFGSHFAGVLWQSYGGVFAGNPFFDPSAPPRKRRALRVDAPELHGFATDDGVELRLTRHRGGAKGPVMLVHGLGVGSTIFSTDTIETNLLEYLYAHGYDVWLLDFRVSILLDASRGQSTADQVAKYDFAAAIERIRQVTGAPDVQCVVHCYGATTFFMAMLAGLQGVRSIVCSQIATDIVVPAATAIKTGLHVPGVLDRLGVESLTAYTDRNANWFNKLYDSALDLYALAEAQGQCDSPVCHRITFMYASLYRHDTLNETLHENLHELFGESNMRSFEHLALLCREGRLLNFAGEDVYMPHDERLRLPICFISGADNRCYLPASTERTYERLRGKFDPALYSRHVVPGYGHIDCIFGKNAVVDVYPLMLAHLEKTAVVNGG